MSQRHNLVTPRKGTRSIAAQADPPGPVLPAMFLAADLAPGSAAALPAALLENTAHAAMQLAAGEGVTSAAAAALAKLTLRTMLIPKLTLAASLATIGVALAVRGSCIQSAMPPHRPAAVPRRATSSSVRTTRLIRASLT